VVALLLGRRLAQRGAIYGTPEGFAHARLGAERLAWQNRGIGEYTLADVYRELGRALHLSAEECLRLADEELRLESELLRPVPAVRAEIEQARASGERVAFLSDTFLPRDFLREQLLTHAIADPADDVYASCEVGATKRTGAMFDRLRDASRRTFGEIHHHGNDALGDVAAPRRRGIRTTYFEAGNLNRYEQALDAHAWSTEGLSSILSGSARLTRLTVPAGNAHEVTVRDVAAGVVAPALVGYVLWVLHRARSLGLRRLYFVARDGQILLEIARRLAPKLGVRCELLYLHGSRYAWWLPSVHRVSAEDLDWIYPSFRSITLQDVVDRLGLEPHEAAPLTAALESGSPDWSAQLSSDDRKRLVQRLLEDEPLQALILKRAAAKRSLMARYLEQSGLLEDDDWAIVDVGWWGTLYASLSKVLAHLGRPQPRGFYFGVNGDEPSDDGVLLEGYMYDCRFKTGFVQEMAPFSWCLIDVFCTGLDGQTMEYAEGSGGEVVPVLRNHRNDPALYWGLPLLRATVDHFAATLPLDADWANPAADVRAAVVDAVRAFWFQPTPVEASTWGALPRQNEWGTFDAFLAMPYSWRYLLSRLRGDLGQRQRHGFWQTGSVMVSPWPQRLAMRAMQQGLEPARRTVRFVSRRLRLRRP
jgi:FMN phosphatase YigB (HAD superfamily)